MIKLIIDYCSQHNLFHPHEHLLLACSGGADSICMVHIFSRLAAQYDFVLHVAHVEHGIRGASSYADAEFVRAFCQSLDLPFHLAHFDVPAQAKQWQLGVEDTARRMRYGFLQRTAKKIGCQAIVLAHHRGDQAETVLMHLLRGAGLKGIAGILPQNGNLIRPMLNCTRQQIEDYCRNHQLSYCHDLTNDDQAYTRNKIRHQLLPMLAAYNPDIERALCNTAALAAETAAFLEGQAALFLECSSKQTARGIALSVQPLLQEHPALQKQILRLALARQFHSLQDIGALHIEKIIALLKVHRTGSQLDLPCQLQASISYDWLLLQHVDLLVADILAPLPLNLPGTTVIAKAACSITATFTAQRTVDTRSCCSFACDKLPEKLFLRGRRNGDIFFPKGIEGHKKLKKLFIDQKIPRDRRDTWPLLCDGDGSIVWVCGIQPDRRYLPDAQTDRFLQLKINFQNNTKGGYPMHKDVEKILFDEATVKARIKELGAQIAKDYDGREVVAVGILKGAIVFFADLVRAIDIPVRFDFMAASSYGASTKTSGVVRILKDIDTDIEGKDVIIIEDIIDSGLTLKYLKENFEHRKARSVKLCALLDKPEGRRCDVKGDYIGFSVPNEFIVGYGLDYASLYRNLPYVAVLKKSVYEK